MGAGITFIGNTRSAPAWQGDFGGREHLLPMPAKLNAALFTDSAGVKVIVSGAAAQGATSIPISALTLSALTTTNLLGAGNVLIPSGTVLDFGGAKFARLTADALNGATTLTVAALVTALVLNDTATYSRLGTKVIPSGTLISRDNDNVIGTNPFGPAVSTDSEIYLLCYDVVNVNVPNNTLLDCELYRHHSLVKENYLPNYAAMFAAAGATELNNQLLAIRSLYTTIEGYN